MATGYHLSIYRTARPHHHPLTPLQKSVLHGRSIVSSFCEGSGSRCCRTLSWMRGWVYATPSPDLPAWWEPRRMTETILRVLQSTVSAALTTTSSTTPSLASWRPIGSSHRARVRSWPSCLILLHLWTCSKMRRWRKSREMSWCPKWRMMKWRSKRKTWSPLS